MHFQTVKASIGKIENLRLLETGRIMYDLLVRKHRMTEELRES